MGHIVQIDGCYFAGALGVVAARGVTGHFEQPCAKQLVIAHLSRLSVNRQHDFLGQILRDARLVASFSKEGKQLRRKDAKQVVVRIFIEPAKKLSGGFTLSQVRHWHLHPIHTLKERRGGHIPRSVDFQLPRLDGNARNSKALGLSTQPAAPTNTQQARSSWVNLCRTDKSRSYAGRFPCSRCSSGPRLLPQNA